MDWMPNVDGAIWFVRQVLPLIHRRRPQTVAALVGRKPDPRLQEARGPRRAHHRDRPGRSAVSVRVAGFDCSPACRRRNQIEDL